MTGDGYDAWAKAVNYVEPENFCKLVGPDCPADLSPANCKVLDVGAGTGICGRLLKEKGFADITAVDASESLLEKLKEQDAYNDVRLRRLGLGVDKFDDDLKGKFDLVTAGGVFMKGHLPPAGMDDIHAALKRGGYFVTGMRSYYWVDGQEDGFKDKAEELIAAGKFKLVHKGTCMRGVKGEIAIFEEMESTLLVFQKELA